MLLKFGYHYGKKTWARQGARKVLVFSIKVHFLAPGGGHISQNFLAVGSADLTAKNSMV
jgi:hypothetical protein